jgi:hypothetical protein
MDPKGFGWVFNVNGKQYEAKISLEQIAAGLGWTPAAALPLSFAKAEEIARGELRKLVTDDSTWEVTELNLRRSGEQADSKWFYLVKLMPKVRERNAIADSFTLPISFSGAIGRVQLYGLAR